MGRIVTQLKLTNLVDPSKTLSVSALVDTGAAYITLPDAWRQSLGEVEQLAEIDVELGDGCRSEFYRGGCRKNGDWLAFPPAGATRFLPLSLGKACLSR